MKAEVHGRFAAAAAAAVAAAAAAAAAAAGAERQIFAARAARALR